MSPKFFTLVFLVVLSPKTQATHHPCPPCSAELCREPLSFHPQKQPTPWYRNEGKHSLIFNLTSDHSAMGITHFQTLWWETLGGWGEAGRRTETQNGVEEIEIKDLGERRG